MFKKTEEKKLFPLPNSHYPISLKKKKTNKRSVQKQLTIKNSLKQLTTHEQYKKSATRCINIIKNK